MPKSKFTKPEVTVEVYCTLRRRRRSGHFEYTLGSNFMPRPKGWRRVDGTSSAQRGLAMKLLQECQDGTFWENRKKDRSGLGNALRAQRKAIALAYKKSKRKHDFDWTKIRRLSRDF
jgi:hypothetical protein